MESSASRSRFLTSRHAATSPALFGPDHRAMTYLNKDEQQLRLRDWTEVRRLKNVLADRENADVETQFREANLYMNVLNHQKVMERGLAIAGGQTHS